MDAFDRIPEPPDLTDQLIKLGQMPVFSSRYSYIYRGKLGQDGRMVAIKVLISLRGKALSSMRRKLKRERKVWAALDHPNVLPLWGIAEDEERFGPYGGLIAPWLQNGDAVDFLQERGLLMTAEERISLWKGVVAGISYLHSYTPLLVHGDLKPRNILIDDGGHPRICDFGLVRICLDAGLKSGMTTTTDHTGTERYLAYELVIAGEDAITTTESDIYAVGCIGLEFIFSQAPYHTRKAGFVLTDIKNGIPPAKRATNLPPFFGTIWSVLECCWDKSPSNRPSATSLFVLVEELECQFGQVPLLGSAEETILTVKDENPKRPNQKHASIVSDDMQKMIDTERYSSSLSAYGPNGTRPSSSNPDDETKVDVLSTAGVNSPFAIRRGPLGEPTESSSGGLDKIKRGRTLSGISPFRKGSRSIAQSLHLNTGISAFFF